MSNSLDFYNKFDTKLIKDYVLGNKRIESAIINLRRFVPKNSSNILDIGCGLGWSSYEFSLSFKNSKIEGIDLSPVLIEKASKLFVSDNLEYKVYDVTQGIPLKTYDAIVMIDVYEHIESSQRANFHLSLKRLIKTNGRLILACPSKFHQEWLRQHKPEGLQPVDEDVDYDCISRLAEDIGGEVIYFEYQRIWRNSDYFYAVIEIAPNYNLNMELKLPIEYISENLYSRKDRVETNLGIKLDYDIKKPKQRIKMQVLRRLKELINR